MEELIIYQKVYDFMCYFFPLVERFPKSEKFVLCAQVKNGVWDILKLIIRANKSRNKTPLLFEIDVLLVQVKTMVKFAHQRRYLSTQKWEHAGKLLAEIGRLLGGWLKSCSRGVTPFEQRGKGC
ncbi:MAG: diversity-generating retroelement protein Avd [Candidatus Omnitrophota bacterium]